MRPAGGRTRQRLIAASVLSGLLSLSVFSAGCSARTPKSAHPHRGAAATRPSTADTCTISPRRARVLGLPVVDAETVRIAPDVVGEKLTWQAGRRHVTAWVGVDALDAFEDLDFVAVEVAGGAGRPREWTTRVRPDLFVVEAKTGLAPPCDLLYISTEGLPAQAAVEVSGDLQVALTPREDVTPP